MTQAQHDDAYLRQWAKTVAQLRVLRLTRWIDHERKMEALEAKYERNGGENEDIIHN